MPKRIIPFVILVFLASCNLPINPEPTPDIVATEVANMLTLTPLNQPAETGENQETPSPQTPDPSETSQLSTDTPTLTPTATLTITPTQANIPTGSADWIDTFETGTRFGLTGSGYDDGNTMIRIENNEMVLTSVNANGWRGWRLTSQKPAHYYLEALFSVENCSGSDQYGLIIQAPDFDTGYGYYFGLTCDGRFSIQRWDESGLTSIRGWESAQVIQSGSNQTNTLGIIKSGNQYELFVNDESIAEMQDERFSSPGFFGPFIAGINTAGFTVHLDEIAYWNLP